MRDIWRNRPDLSPHDALVPAVALDETNPAATLEAKASSELDLDFDDRFSLLLWTMVKGEDVPYPEAKRQRPLERIGQ